MKFKYLDITLRFQVLLHFTHFCLSKSIGERKFVADFISHAFELELCHFVMNYVWIYVYEYIKAKQKFNFSLLAIPWRIHVNCKPAFIFSCVVLKMFMKKVCNQNAESEYFNGRCSSDHARLSATMCSINLYYYNRFCKTINVDFYSEWKMSIDS